MGDTSYRKRARWTSGCHHISLTKQVRRKMQELQKWKALRIAVASAASLTAGACVFARSKYAAPETKLKAA
jgi:hypothetical protein